MTERAREAGAMTRAMSSKQPLEHLERVLRIGVLQGASSIEERTVKTRETVSAGTTERATLVVSSKDFPSHVELFTVRGGRWHLVIPSGAEVRVALRGEVHTAESLRAKGLAKPEGAATVLPLDDSARGKLSLAGVTFLFQFAPAPPPAPKAQIPQSLRASLTREIDWRYHSALAGFLSLALGAMTWVEYGYDPIVDDRADLLEYVARRIHMAPPDDSTPAEPREAAAAPADTADTSAPSPRSDAPHTRPTPSHAPSNTAANAPSQSHVAQAAARAAEAAAAVERALDADFAALTTTAAMPGSAREQLQNGTLMGGTAEDLRNVHGVSTTGTTLARPSLTAQAHGLPGSQTLGRPQTLATHDAPGTGNLTGPVGPRRPPTIDPDPPSTDTCEGDAGAVARVLRGNLGGIRSCYERAARTNPTLAGRLVVHFTVGESGRAINASVRGVDPELDACVERAVGRLVFPAPACGAAEFEYPVTVGPAE